MKNKKDKKKHKGVEEIKLQIPMVLEEDLNPENISNVITVTKLATRRKSVEFGKRNRIKKRKKIKRLIQLLLKVIS